MTRQIKPKIRMTLSDFLVRGGASVQKTNTAGVHPCAVIYIIPRAAQVPFWVISTRGNGMLRDLYICSAS